MTIGIRAARWGATAALIALTAACFAAPAPAPEPEPDPTTSTGGTVDPEPGPRVLTPVLRLPDGRAAVVPGTDAVALAAGTARSLYASAPLVVVAPAGDTAAQLEAAAVAVAAGVPLLLAVPVPQGVPAPAEPAATIAALGAEVVLGVGYGLDPTAVGHEVVALADAAAQTGTTPSATPADLAAVAELDRPTVGPRAGTTLGADLLGEAGPIEGSLVLTTGDRAAVAAVATARAAGVPVAVTPGDPRSTDDVIALIAEAEPRHTIGLGADFGDADLLAARLATASGGHLLPGGGQLVFHDKAYVAMYGSPGIPALGVLGEQDVAGAVQRVRELAAPYQEMTDLTVVPTFEIIASIASAGPGEDGTYSWKLDPEALRPWIETAAAEGVYVVLDLQPGRQDFVTQAKHYESLLLYPNVGLALDPEWRLEPHQVHLRQIGHVGIDEVNAVADYLAGLTREHGLPQKMLVLHQFMLRMIDGRERLTSHDELAMVIHVDGQGSQGAKAGTWAAIREGAPAGVHWGWKNFYDEDVPMLDPAGTYQVVPRPDLVTYQ